MIKTYNKLVRDLIPSIINASGAKCKIKILSDEEYIKMLNVKLDEELTEYHKDQNVEELVDLLEVIYTIAKTHGYSKEDLEALRTVKADSRGGFDKKILLIETTENNKDI